MSFLFASGCFAGFLIATFAAIFVIVRNPRSNLNRSFLITATASAVYNLGVGIYILGDPAKVLTIHRISVSSWLVFLVAQLYFSMAMAQREEKTYDRWLLGLVGSLTLGLALIDWSGPYIYQPPIASFWGNRTLPGPYYYYFTVFSVLVAALQFTYFGVAWAKTKNWRGREQVITVMIGLAAGAFFGGFFDVIAPLGGFFTQSFGWLASTVYVSSFAYAMVRYGLLAVTPGTIAGDVINTMPDLLVVVSPDRRISLVNQRMVDQLGYTAPELIGKTPEWLIAAPEAEAMYRQLDLKLAESRLLKEWQTQLRCKDGSVFPVRLDAVRARDQFGNELGNILIFHDISEEQKLLAKQEAMIAELTKTKGVMLSLLGDTTTARDEAKQKAAELAKAIEDLKVVDKMKTEFLSVISQELRTPLTSINESAAILLNGRVGQLSDDQKKTVESISSEGSHLLKLMNSVLDVSRMVAGRVMEIRKEPVLMKRLLDELALALAPQLKEKQLNFSLDLPPNFPTIQANQDKLSELLTNILGNCLNFTPPTGWVKVTGRVQGDQVELQIADSGIGLAKENLEKIFEKFFQVDSSLTRVSGGVGLGLSIAREIVNAHGGKIWAESKGLGWGTTIKFTLPIT